MLTNHWDAMYCGCVCACFSRCLAAAEWFWLSVKSFNCLFVVAREWDASPGVVGMGTMIGSWGSGICCGDGDKWSWVVGVVWFLLRRTTQDFMWLGGPSKVERSGHRTSVPTVTGQLCYLSTIFITNCECKMTWKRFSCQREVMLLLAWASIWILCWGQVSFSGKHETADVCWNDTDITLDFNERQKHVVFISIPPASFCKGYCHANYLKLAWLAS